MSLYDLDAVLLLLVGVAGCLREITLTTLFWDDLETDEAKDLSLTGEGMFSSCDFTLDAQLLERDIEAARDEVAGKDFW